MESSTRSAERSHKHKHKSCYLHKKVSQQDSGGGIKEGTPSNALKQQVSRLLFFFPPRWSENAPAKPPTSRGGGSNSSGGGGDGGGANWGHENSNHLNRHLVQKNVCFFSPCSIFLSLDPLLLSGVSTENVTREERASKKARVGASERASFFPTKKCEKCQRFFFSRRRVRAAAESGAQSGAPCCNSDRNRPSICLSIYLGDGGTRPTATSPHGINS